MIINLNGDFKNKFVVTKDKRILKIIYFHKTNDQIFVEVEQFKKLENFYSYPIKSSHLDKFLNVKNLLLMNES